MIVQPDFPDHWKTRLVVTRSGSEASVRCILRLWGYCQQRRRWVIPELTPEMLASICGWDGDVDPFWSAMLETYIDETDEGFVVHDWAETNGTLISNWKNGQNGGRPKKPGKEAAKEPMGLPMGKPADNPLETDKRREEKIREEESEGKPSSPGGAGNGGEDGHKGSSADKRPDEAGSEDGSNGVPSEDKRAPLRQITDLYHDLCPTLPRVQKIEGKRLQAVRARWRAAGKAPLDWFQALFCMAGESERIRGGTWCGFDWLMSPSNAQKVLEGNYANGRQNGTGGRPRRFIN